MVKKLHQKKCKSFFRLYVLCDFWYPEFAKKKKNINKYSWKYSQLFDLKNKRYYINFCLNYRHTNASKILWYLLMLVVKLINGCSNTKSLMAHLGKLLTFGMNSTLTMAIIYDTRFLSDMCFEWIIKCICSLISLRAQLYWQLEYRKKIND
jgi:hypothetical protein